MRQRNDIAPKTIHAGFLRAHSLVHRLSQLHLGKYAQTIHKPHASLIIDSNVLNQTDDTKVVFLDPKISKEFGLEPFVYLGALHGKERQFYRPAYRHCAENPFDIDLFAMSRVIWFPERALCAKIKADCESYQQLWALRQYRMTPDSKPDALFNTAQIQHIDSVTTTVLNNANATLMQNLLDTREGFLPHQTDTLSYQASLMIAHDVYAKQYPCEQNVNAQQEEAPQLDIKSIRSELVDNLIEKALEKARFYTNDPVKKYAASELIKMRMSVARSPSESTLQISDADSNSDTDHEPAPNEFQAYAKQKAILKAAVHIFRKHRWFSSFRSGLLSRVAPLNWLFTKIFTPTPRAYSESEDYLFKAAQLIDADFYTELKQSMKKEDFQQVVNSRYGLFSNNRLSGADNPISGQCLYAKLSESVT